MNSAACRAVASPSYSTGWGRRFGRVDRRSIRKARCNVRCNGRAGRQISAGSAPSSGQAGGAAAHLNRRRGEPAAAPRHTAVIAGSSAPRIAAVAQPTTPEPAGESATFKCPNGPPWCGPHSRSYALVSSSRSSSALALSQRTRSARASGACLRGATRRQPQPAQPSSIAHRTSACPPAQHLETTCWGEQLGYPSPTTCARRTNVRGSNTSSWTRNRSPSRMR
jgi:hypothetical protein